MNKQLEVEILSPTNKKKAMYVWIRLSDTVATLKKLIQNKTQFNNKYVIIYAPKHIKNRSVSRSLHIDENGVCVCVCVCFFFFLRKFVVFKNFFLFGFNYTLHKI